MPTSVIVRERSGSLAPLQNTDTIENIYVFTTFSADYTEPSNLDDFPPNVPVEVNDLLLIEQFYPAQTISDIQGIILNAPEAKVLLINCAVLKAEQIDDETVLVIDPDASELDHLLNGIYEISLDSTLDPGIMLVPETGNTTGGLSTEPSLTQIQSTLDKLASERHWMFFLNAPLRTTSDGDYVAEVARYVSELGHTSYYAGGVVYDENVTSLAAIAAAIATKATLAEGASQSPAGIGYPIVYPQEVLDYNNLTDQFDALRDAGINVLTLKKTRGYVIWGARTLSKNRRFLYINTRQCINQVAVNLELALEPFLLDPVDPRGNTTAQIEMACTSVMEQAFEDGYLEGETAAQAYSIIRLPLNEQGIIEIEITGNFVGSIETIQITLINGEVLV